MKKNLLFLFAASALFAACSSDELPNGNTPGDGEQSTEVTDLPTSFTVTSEEGVGMRFSTSEDADTRATDENVSFKMQIGLDQTMYEQFSENYVLKADDFAIRINGDYVTFNESEVSDNSATYGVLSISRTTNSDLTLTIEATGLNTDLQTGQAPTHVDNIAFEAYIWIQNKAALSGSGSYGERFTYEQKLAWIGKTAPITYETERGVDITDNCVAEPTEGENKEIFGLIGNDSGYGYAVRYNAYRGISGRPVNADGEFDTNTGIGDTPYIKVSIAVDQVGEDERSSVTPVYPTPNAD